MTIPACDWAIDEPLITKVFRRFSETVANRRGPCRSFHPDPADEGLHTTLPSPLVLLQTKS